MKGITEKMIFTVFGIVGVIFLIIVFFARYGDVLIPVCWENTLMDLNQLNRERSGGVGKLLGEEEFYLPVQIASACGLSIQFSDYAACRRACSTYEESEQCAKECLDCQNANGCVVAVPASLSKWNVLAPWQRNYLDKVKLSFLGFFRAYRSEFQFGGEANALTIQAPQEGVVDVCLHFTKTTENIYRIERVERTREACE